MKILTPSGIAEGQPLSDIQEYNKQLSGIKQAVWILILFLIGFVLWVTFYIIHNDVVNNIVRRCVC